MTDFVEHLIDVVKVHIVGDDTKRHDTPKPVVKEVNATFRSFTLSNTTDPQRILDHAPRRRRAILQFTTAGPVVLGNSRSDVSAVGVVGQGSQCAQINVAAAGIIELQTTREVWAQSTVAGLTNVAVISEFETDI